MRRTCVQIQRGDYSSIIPQMIGKLHISIVYYDTHNYGDGISENVNLRIVLLFLNSAMKTGMF